MTRLTAFGAIVLTFLLAAPAAAQVTTANKIVLDEPAPSLAVANGYQYKYYEGVAAGVVLTGTSCTGVSSPFTCTFNFPAFTPGSHSITLTASDTTVTPALESAKSTQLTFVFVIAPAVPQNPRTQ